MPRTVPTRTLKWPRRNRVQITCNTHCAHHVQHVVCHLERRDSAAIKVGRVEIAFTTALSFCLKRLSDGFMRNELKNRTCCHTYTETEVADQACFLTQPPYTDTGPTSPSTGRLRQTPDRAITRAPVPTKVPKFLSHSSVSAGESRGHSLRLPLTMLFVGWLVNVPATRLCILGAELLRQLYALPH